MTLCSLKAACGLDVLIWADFFSLGSTIVGPDDGNDFAVLTAQRTSGAFTNYLCLTVTWNTINSKSVVKNYPFGKVA